MSEHPNVLEGGPKQSTVALDRGDPRCDRANRGAAIVLLGYILVPVSLADRGGGF